MLITNKFLKCPVLEASCCRGLDSCLFGWQHRENGPASCSTWAATAREGYHSQRSWIQIGKAHISNQTGSLVMIAPAYATAHMSQILIEPEESTVFLNRSFKRFRCALLCFPIAILWEFNLIPADILYHGMGLWGKKIRKKMNKKRIRTDWNTFHFFEKDIWVSISLSLSLSPSF